MKRILFLLMACLVVLTACSNQSTGDSGGSANAGGDPTQPLKVDVDIGDENFFEKIDDFYANAEGNLGKVVKINGFLCIGEVDIGEAFPKPVYSVLRFISGYDIDGHNHRAGFEVQWDGEYPDGGSWVEAIGVFEKFEQQGDWYCRLVLSSLTVCPKPDNEFLPEVANDLLPE